MAYYCQGFCVLPDGVPTRVLAVCPRWTGDKGAGIASAAAQ